jgi:transposase
VFNAGSRAQSSDRGADLKTLHAKIGELTLENDFLSAALGKAGLPSSKR